jgi:hypothetical protein
LLRLDYSRHHKFATGACKTACKGLTSSKGLSLRQCTPALELRANPSAMLSVLLMLGRVPKPIAPRRGRSHFHRLAAAARH